MNIFKPRLKLVKGTRFISFLFIACSVLIAAGILIAANMYYNIDTGEIVMEEIQRTTGLIRALGGVIVGGADTSTLPDGVAFQVATTSFATTSDVLLSVADQILRFSGGSNDYYVGMKATTTLATTTVWTLPSADGSSGYALVTDGDGNLSWDLPTGMGTITAVGNATTGEAFTASVPGEYLWFGPDSEVAGNRGQLTVDSSLTGTGINWTLPALSGTVTLASGGLGADGGVLFVNSGLIATSTNFQWENSNRRLSLGTASTANGILRFYGGTSGYVDFQATTTGSGITYTWPQAGGDGLYLRTDTSGNLSWSSLEGGGAVTGGGASGRVAFWTSGTEIDDSANFLWDNANSRLGIGTTTLPTHSLDVYGTARISNSLIVPLIQSAGTLTLEALSGNIVLYPSTGIVELGTSTYIETASGYKIGATGTEVLREMIPIMGFDLPVRTATSGTVQISRTIENYPVSSCVAGTSRIHKLVIRYGSVGTTTWEVATSNAAYTSFDLPPTNSTTTGTVHTATTSIPTPAGACTGWIQNSATDEWWVRVNPGGNDTMIYQIFLAAYDQIQ